MREEHGGGDVTDSGNTLVQAKANEGGRASVAPKATEHARVTALMERAQRGDEKAMQELRSLLAQAPG